MVWALVAQAAGCGYQVHLPDDRDAAVADRGCGDALEAEIWIRP